MNPLWPAWARGVWAAMVVAGGLVCAAGWWGASREPVFADQARWSSLSVAGLLVVFAAHGAWFLAGRRAVGLRQARLLGDPDPAGVAHRPEAGGGRLPAGGFVGGDGLRRYHRPGCPMAAGRAWPALAAAAVAGREPCGICRPERP